LELLRGSERGTGSSAVLKVGAQEINVFCNPDSADRSGPQRIDHFCLMVESTTIDDVVERCVGQGPASMLIYSRGMMLSPWYRRIFPTRFAAHRQAVQEFVTTRQGYRLATSTRWGADRTWGRHHRDR
jgi:hypothetical protein